MKTLTNTQIRQAIELADKGFSIPKISAQMGDIDQRLLRRYLNKADRDVDPAGSVAVKAQLKAIITKFVPIAMLPTSPDIEEMSYKALKEYWESIKEQARG